MAAGWAWASGGVVSTPSDADQFVRAYVRGETTNSATREKQFQFVNGTSEPPGPGTNAAGPATFRYQTDCGTVFGHTGNTLGYTQFIAASANGRTRQRDCERADHAKSQRISLPAASTGVRARCVRGRTGLRREAEPAPSERQHRRVARPRIEVFCSLQP